MKVFIELYVTVVLKEPNLKAFFLDIVFVMPVIVGDNCWTRTGWGFDGGKDWGYM